MWRALLSLVVVLSSGCATFERWGNPARGRSDPLVRLTVLEIEARMPETQRKAATAGETAPSGEPELVEEAPGDPGDG